MVTIGAIRRVDLMDTKAGDVFETMERTVTRNGSTRWGIVLKNASSFNHVRWYVDGAEDIFC